MVTSFDNNEDKICSLFKNNVGRSRVRLRGRSYYHKSCKHGIINKCINNEHAEKTQKAYKAQKALINKK